MPNLSRFIILSITTLTLYIALISPYLLPNTVIPIRDALIIIFYVLITYILFRFISYFQHKKLEKKVNDQHYLMEAILHNTPVIVCLKNVDGTILLANQGMALMLGEKLEDLEGKNVRDYYKNAEAFLKEDSQVIEKGVCLRMERFIETVNGTSGWFRTIKAPILDKEGDIVGIVVIMSNIDADKEIEQCKSDFIATLTHDLKTPTIAQIKALDLLLNGTFGDLDAEQSEIVSQIKDSCNYMYDLIFTILDTYLYENGQTQINFETFDLNYLVEQVACSVSNLVQQKNQQIVIKSLLTKDKIVGDRLQLQRVIINLIGNANTYGFRNTNIELELTEDSNSYIFTVKNIAKYIPEDKIVDMFEKFKKTENSKSCKTGTGLGLFLSKKIITAHKGSVFAKSDVDGTCVFGFSIPKNLEVSSQLTNQAEVESTLS